MNQDFRDLLHEFNVHDVEFIVVGAHALAAHGHVRATKDMDVWVRASSDLIQNKRAADRDQDRADVKWLESLNDNG